MNTGQMHEDLDRSTLGKQQACIGRQQLQRIIAFSFFCCS